MFGNDNDCIYRYDMHLIIIYDLMITFERYHEYTHTHTHTLLQAFLDQQRFF